MSKLGQSDQLCLFNYMSEANELSGTNDVSEANDLSEATINPSSHGSQDQAPLSIDVATDDGMKAVRWEDASEEEDSLERTPMTTALQLALMQNLGSSSPVNSTNGAVKDRAVKDRAVKDRAVKDRAVKDRAVKDRAVEDGAVEGEAADALSPEPISKPQERIFHLEQALDQALRYLDELNTRVKHQAILEEQVTLTEEYAYVQYQAIARLEEDLANNKEMIDQRNLTITALESDRALAQTNLLSLQQDQLSLRQENAQWKNACQELQQECDRQHRKMMALEQENTAMQEQILQQARQSNEYETAVQYWKDRYTSLQQHLHAFQDILEEKMNSPNLEAMNADISNFLVYIQSIGTEETVEPNVDTLSASNLNSFSIPDFLIRRYRHRGSGISNKPQ